MSPRHFYAQSRRRADQRARGQADQLHRQHRKGPHHPPHAAEHLKPVLLALGGKAPLIVLADADLDEAGKAEIDSFTETRWITIQPQPGHFPI